MTAYLPQDLGRVAEGTTAVVLEYGKLSERKMECCVTGTHVHLHVSPYCGVCH